MNLKKEQIKQMLDLIISLALDCSEHLTKQHNQKENDKPRFFFDNIAKQARDLRDEILGEKEGSS